MKLSLGKQICVLLLLSLLSYMKVIGIRRLYKLFVRLNKLFLENQSQPQPPPDNMLMLCRKPRLNSKLHSCTYKHLSTLTLLSSDTEATATCQKTVLPDARRGSHNVFDYARRGNCNFVDCFKGRRNIRTAKSYASSLQQQNRHFSSSAPPTPNARQRFYLSVDIQPCKAPWEQDSSNTDSSKKLKATTVESPISAGVDGTKSASGVVHLKNQQQAKQKQRLLQPTQPSPTLASESDTTNERSKPSDSISSVTSWYTVTLDGRVLRTPMGQTLAVPSRELASCIATEWNSVETTIVPIQMPFMTLCCTALDQTCNAIDTYRVEILRYLQTDTICYWADPVQDRGLYKHQQTQWDSIHEWVTSEFCCGGTIPAPAQAFGKSEGVVMVQRRKHQKQQDDVTTSRKDVVVGLPHTQKLRTACKAWVNSLDAWHLTALYVLCSETKSFFISACMLVSSSSSSKTVVLTPKQAVAACRVEEEYQISSWGCVEGQHDYDRLNANIQITSATILSRLCHLA